jgi:hypothetical protein
MLSVRRHVFGFLVIALLTALAWIAVARFALRRPSHAVHFVVPNGWRGIFKLVPGRENCYEPTTNGERVTYVVPDSGVLVVCDAVPLGSWHTLTASFLDGTLIRVNEDSDSLSLSLYPLGSTSQDIWYVVGTKADRELALGQFAALETGRPQTGRIPGS